MSRFRFSSAACCRGWSCRRPCRSSRSPRSSSAGAAGSTSAGGSGLDGSRSPRSPASSRSSRSRSARCAASSRPRRRWPRREQRQPAEREDDPRQVERQRPDAARRLLERQRRQRPATRGPQRGELASLHRRRESGQILARRRPRGGRTLGRRRGAPGSARRCPPELRAATSARARSQRVATRRRLAPRRAVLERQLMGALSTILAGACAGLLGVVGACASHPARRPPLAPVLATGEATAVPTTSLSPERRAAWDVDPGCRQATSRRRCTRARRRARAHARHHRPGGARRHRLRGAGRLAANRWDHP